MKLPLNLERPIFAYGLFKPGQLAFFQIQDFVSRKPEPARVRGTLLLRDGLPIMDPEGEDRVTGAVMTFHPAYAREAYERISTMEPDKHYRWDEMKIRSPGLIMVTGKSPRDGKRRYPAGK